MRLSYTNTPVTINSLLRICALTALMLMALALLTACSTTSGSEVPRKGGYPMSPRKSPSATSPSSAPPPRSTVPSTYTPPVGGVPVYPDAPPQPLATPSPAPVSKQAPVAAPKPAPAQAKTAPTAVPPPAPTAASRVAAGMGKPVTAPSGGVVADCWQPLVKRLQNDPNAGPEVINYFCSLPSYSPAPMGAKVKELFTGAFMRKPSSGKPSGPPSRIYRSVVTEANVEKCKVFLAQYKSTFAAVEKKYPVPKEILVSLLFVETRLGTYIGKENAFWSLACMAAADSPEMMKGGLDGIPITSKHDTWLQAKLTDKSNWAYKEMRALLKYCSVQRLDPHNMPGSVYGAIGICQFMPSNLVPYGDDGDGDGVINLFSPPDAIFSAAKYLTKHGWAAGQSVDKQRSVLKRYNNLNIYANTILAMAESIRTGVLQTGPPDAVKKPAAKPVAKAKKAPAKGKKSK